MKLIQQLHDFISMHATVGANVLVMHHDDGYIGAVTKTSGQFTPVDVISKRPGVKLPSQLNLDREAVLASARLSNWDAIETKLICKMKAKERREHKRKRVAKAEEKVMLASIKPGEGWHGHGLHREKPRYKCSRCGKTTVVPALYAVSHDCEDN
jgi:hypothetical protein